MNTKADALRALSDKAHARLELLEEQYRAAIKKGDHALAAVLKGEDLAAIAYAQAIEDCRGLLR
jgi:hypothetical protein